MRMLCIVLLAISGLAGYWWIRTYESVEVVQSQLAAIGEGRYPQAYDYLSSMAKTTLPFEEFVALIQNNSVVMETRSASFPLRTREGPTAIISGMLTGYGALISQVSYIVVQEKDQWKIQSFHWAPPREDE